MSKGLRMVEYFSHFLASTIRQELAIVVRKKISIELLFKVLREMLNTSRLDRNKRQVR
jgi:hypothetical protein